METISIALICTILGVAISYLTFQKNKDNAIRAETKEDAETKAQLDYIRLDIKFQDRKIEDLKERVTRVEESTKQAHKRINDI